MKLRLSQILYLILAIPIALSPLFPVTANASSVNGMPADPQFALPDSVDEFNLATSTTAQLAAPTEPDSWPMAAANPERTSWTPEEVRGRLSPEWYKPFEPYIPQKVQIIAAYGMLYISTAKGLYALDAETGAENWVYPTELPLGHSPTIHNGVAYVGGFDHKLHAVDAMTGQGLWTFEAEKGFQTNPLVVDGIVFAGNRDGYMYAIGAHGTSNQGQLIWRYKTDGPVLFSAAYKDGVIYFASNDSFAYALNAQTGALVWKSDKLPGAGFHSWWPVVNGEWVIFAGSNNYRFGGGIGPGSLANLDEAYVFPNREVDPRGTLVGPLGQEPGDWVDGTPTIDTSQSNSTPNGATRPITEYLEEMPWRRTTFVLDSQTGEEYVSDFDNDGYPEYAPFLWFGTHGAGNRYPPVVGNDGVLYQTNMYMSDPYIAAGQISGWRPGSPHISVVSSDWGAQDEPHAYSAGGNLIYWNLCCDREAGAFDISIPNTRFAERRGGFMDNREWRYFVYNLPELIPGYNNETYISNPYYHVIGGVFGDRDGSYGWHGDINPPIPYNEKVYIHRSNAVIAFSPQTGTPDALSKVQIVDIQNANLSNIRKEQIKSSLINEVEKIIQAGHLRPGYVGSGIFDHVASSRCGDDLADYWHNPGDILYTLISALPHLPEEIQDQVKFYLQNEFSAYPPFQFNHIGWRDGTSREAFDLPPDVESDRINYPPESAIYGFEGWTFAPHTFYALWKYAETFGGALDIFNASRNKLESVPPKNVLYEMPHVHNAYIAGYIGYLELEKLAGYEESSNIRDQLNQLINLRISNFTPHTSDEFFENRQKRYCRALNTSRNFMYLVPELGEYLNDGARNKIQDALSIYYGNAPYWFVSKAEVQFGEGVVNHLYDYHAIFQAKALILNEPYEELVKYLDIPAVEVGDLFNIQNLVSVLESSSLLPDAPIPSIEPNGGDFDESVIVNITSSLPEASIYYTLDGTTPSDSSTLYRDPIPLHTSALLQARAFSEGYDPSEIASADFILNHTFADVPFDHWAYDHIESIYQSGFVAGCSTEPPLYCPERILSRAESSVFILRGTYGAITDPPHTSPDTPTFSDVDPAFWGYGWIESLWQDGFTSGCSSDPLSFCPEREHTRAEGSVFFLRIKYGADYEPPTHQGIFTDVTTDSWYIDWVEAAYNEGILPACQVDPLRFCPEDFLDRAWAAFMMIQAKGLGSSGATSTHSPTPTSTPTQPNPPASTPMPTETTSSTSTPTPSP